MSYALTICEGPDCPACGCNDTTALRTDSSEIRIWRAGACEEIVRTTRRRLCNYCGHQWVEREDRPAH